LGRRKVLLLSVAVVILVVTLLVLFLPLIAIEKQSTFEVVNTYTSGVMWNDNVIAEMKCHVQIKNLGDAGSYWVTFYADNEEIRVRGYITSGGTVEFRATFSWPDSDSFTYTVEPPSKTEWKSILQVLAGQ
jgi:hypothetical protein